MIYSPKQIGKQGEQMAREYFERLGFCHLISNFRVPGGEIDLVMRRGATLLICEVKTRRQRFNEAGGTEITLRQRSRILKASWHLAQKFPQMQTKSWQFLAVSINLNQENNQRIQIAPLFTD